MRKSAIETGGSDGLVLKYGGSEMVCLLEQMFGMTSCLE